METPTSMSPPPTESVHSPSTAQSPHSTPLPSPPPYTQAEMQHTLQLQPKRKYTKDSTQVIPQTPPPFQIQTFTTNMDPISDLSRYPSYCLKDSQKGQSSQPLVRARRIFDTGKPVPQDQTCSRCLEHNQICIRASQFSKCAYCTSEDLHPKGMCHLPGVEDPPAEMMSMTALSKKRKMDARTEELENVTRFGGKEGQARFRVEKPSKRVCGGTGRSGQMEKRNKGPRQLLGSVAVDTSIPGVLSEKLTAADSGVDLKMMAILRDLKNRVAVLESLQGKSDTTAVPGTDASTMALRTPLPNPASSVTTETLRADDKDGNLDRGDTDIEMPDSEASTTATELAEEVHVQNDFWKTVSDQ